MLALHPGRNLDRAQIQGILNLVAASVPDLAARAIAVVDQQGQLLSAPGETGAGAPDAKQLDWTREVESGYVRRILDIVEPVVGRYNVRAQVSVEVDFTQSESPAETYQPNQDPREAAVRSQNVSEAGEALARGASGVPGAASNAPGATGAGAPGAGAAGATGKKDSAIQYELDRTVRTVRQATGSVRRISAAVLVNHRRVVEEGKGTLVPLKDEELAQLVALVKEAIGFSKDRGDSLNLMQAAFNAEEVPPAEAVPLWKQPETVAIVLDLGKHLLIAALVFFVALGVLRPLLRVLATPPPSLPAPPEPLPGLGAPGAADAVTAARALARQDPKIVANVVKGWVSGNG
jgi:flagellar M-ring protein FliF